MTSWAYTPIVCLIPKYGAACLDPYREGQVIMLALVQKWVAKFANYSNELVWETLAQRIKTGCICALF
jgi:hypothetical protein